MVVNEKTNIPIEDYLRTRGILHDVLCYGEDFEYHNDGQPVTLGAIMTHLFGKINYYKQINPHKAAKLMKLYEAANIAICDPLPVVDIATKGECNGDNLCLPHVAADR
jgi:hypothetical protein